MSETMEENHKRNYGACLDRERAHLLQLQQQAATIERLTQSRDTWRGLAQEREQINTALQQQVRDLRALLVAGRDGFYPGWDDTEWFARVDAALASSAAPKEEK